MTSRLLLGLEMCGIIRALEPSGIFGSPGFFLLCLLGFAGPCGGGFLLSR